MAATTLALVELSADEIAGQRLNPPTLAAAVSLVEQEGYCVLVSEGGGVSLCDFRSIFTFL